MTKIYHSSAVKFFIVKTMKDIFKRKAGGKMGFFRDLLNIRKAKYPFVSLRGDWQANGDLQDSDIVGAIANCIGSNVGKLHPQIIRNTADGIEVKDNYLTKLLSMRWAPELDTYNALYKMASDLVYNSNAYAVIFYTDDFMRVKSIVPITASNVKIWEADDGNILFRFTWDYDKKEYTLPYTDVIHIRARFNKRRFMGTAPDQQLKTTLEMIDTTNESLRNAVRNSSNLKGYLKYNNFADDEDLKQKVKDFQNAYMNAGNAGGIAGLDNSMEFHEISQTAPIIPTTQSQFFRDNICRYYQINEKILTAAYNENEWNAFYEAVIEPIALQLSMEFTFKLLSERERGFGSKVIFSSNRLQYATLQTRMNIGGGLFDRGIITINEFRELLYYEPIEGGDIRMVSLNYVKADDQSQYQIGQNGNSGSETGSDPAPASKAKKASITRVRKKGGTKKNEE